MDKAMIHEDICLELAQTYKAKNNDYGDSFAKVRKEYPEAIVIRLMDKLERLKTLLKGGQQKVNDESVEDTLKDLANYCIMECVERIVDEEVRKQMCTESCEDVNKADEEARCKYHAEHFFER